MGRELYDEEEYMDCDPDTVAEQLIGHRIIRVDDNTVELDDGTVLEFKGASDCCAWFDVRVHGGACPDNVITAVTVSYADNPRAAEEYDLHVLSDATEIAAIHVEGDPPSGYYCKSFTLRVSHFVQNS
ncbi:hypothetical protein PG2022B_0937 [Bifidobacterium animalis subsp. animalis]|nr:hypothetical protein PG2022B_0937 [Bifidobacterium animalis subsp. animalis]